MSKPLSDDRFNEVQALDFLDLIRSSDEHTAANVAVTAVLDLVNEVKRLRIDLARMTRERDQLDVTVRSSRRTTDRLRQERADVSQPELLAEVQRLQAMLTDREDGIRKLIALENAGVDNWGGYSDAMASLEG